MVDGLMLRAPTHVAAPSEVVRVYGARIAPRSASVLTDRLSFPEVITLENAVRSLGEIAAYTTTTLAVGRGAAAHEVDAALVTATYFGTLGVRPLRGRVLAPEGGEPQREAVISYRYWQRQYGGANAAVGAELRATDAVYTVVGVAPRGFVGVDARPIDVWLPLETGAATLAGYQWKDSWHTKWLQVLARLRPSVPRTAASSEVGLVLSRAADDYVGPDDRLVYSVGPIIAGRGPLKSGTARVMVWLGAVAASVWLIACTNVAHLLLARAMSRQGEIALRVTLGASRGRVVRQLLAEGLIVAVVGWIAAVLVVLLVAWIGERSTLRLMIPPDGGFVDFRTLTFAACLSVAAGLLASGLPAFRMYRADLMAAVRRAGPVARADSSGAAAVLLAGQVALTFVLLVGSGLFVRSLRNVRALRLGIDLDRVIAIPLDVGSRYGEAEANAIYLRLLARAQRTPGVEQASLALAVPFYSAAGVAVLKSDRTLVPEMKTGTPYLNEVTPTYFRTVGTRIVRGRSFAESDNGGSRRVVIVNETLARVLAPQGGVLGQCVYLGDREHCAEIVGVAENARRSAVIEDEMMMVYTPLDQADLGTSHRALLARAASGTDTRVIAGQLRKELQGVDPNLPFLRALTLPEIVAPELLPWRLGATLFTAFGGLALLLAGAGLYGVFAYAVGQRTREIGIRKALGGSDCSALGLVIGRALALTTAGAAVGTTCALAAAPALAPLLFKVEANDVATYVATAILLTAITTAATAAPAWRAARVPPTIAMRDV